MDYVSFGANSLNLSEPSKSPSLTQTLRAHKLPLRALIRLNKQRNSNPKTIVSSLSKENTKTEEQKHWKKNPCLFVG